MKKNTGSKTDGRQQSWQALPGPADPRLLDVSRRIVELTRAKLPREQSIEQGKQLQAELQALQARPHARTAILKAAAALVKACAVAPADDDLAVLHNMLELMLRATSGAKGDLFVRFRQFVNACDEDIGLGLIALRRTGATRGGGSDAQLAQRIAALVERIVRDGLGAFQADMEDATGQTPARLQPGKATRYQVAACVATYLRDRFDPKVSLKDAADRVYGFMPTNGRARFRDTAGSFRDDVFAEEPKATVVAAFRAYGVKRADNLFARSGMRKSRRRKRRAGSS